MTDILANAKQALFDHMAQEHNVTLLASEMQDIVTLCERIAREKAQLLTQQEPIEPEFLWESGEEWTFKIEDIADYIHDAGLSEGETCELCYAIQGKATIKVKENSEHEILDLTPKYFTTPPDTQAKLNKAREALLKLQTKLTDLHEGEGEISLMGRCLDASLIVQQALKDTE